MATPIAMPKLGMTMREGTLVVWPLDLGARVQKGQTVLVIESEKAEVEVGATAAGIFRHIYVEAGRTVPCGTLLGAITATADEIFDAEAFRREQEAHAAVPASAAKPAAKAAPKARGDRGAPVTPAARVRARELGIDPAQLSGSGPGGRVTRADVEAFSARREALVAVAPGVSLEVPSQGEGDPLLLLPGFGADVSAFARQVPVLAESHRVLGINPRGVGLSDAPEQPLYAVSEMAADVAALCETPAHVIGASLGAAVAIELAIAHPERVRSLTLVTPFAEASPRLLAVVDAWCRLAARAESGKLTQGDLARALLPWFFSDAVLADARARERTVRGLAEMAARVPATTLERSAAGLRAWSGTRARDLSRIAAATLVIAAGADLLCPDADAVAAAIPGGRCAVIAAAGHAVALEAPDAVNRAILDQLRRA